MKSGVNFFLFLPIKILLKLCVVVDINKILCCITILYMLFSSELKLNILIIIGDITILSNDRIRVQLWSLGQEYEVYLIYLAILGLRLLKLWILWRSQLIILVESLLAKHLGCLYLMMISHLV